MRSAIRFTGILLLTTLLHGVEIPTIADPQDRLLVEALAQHAQRSARAMTREKCLKQECPEMFCWLDLKELDACLTAYELTGDPERLRDALWGFANLRSVMVVDEAGFLGWRGLPIPPLRDPAKPGVLVDEIQASFRAVAVLSRLLDLMAGEPAVEAENTALRQEYIDLMEQHLVKKWDGHLIDLGERGAIYRWNAAYTPLKANLTLAHEKQSIIIDGLLNLHRVTGNDAHLATAARLGAWLKRCLSLREGRYTWNYWDPAGDWDIHPADPAKWKHWIGREPKGEWFSATATSALRLYHHGIIFDDTDVARLVKTQTEVCWNGDATAPVYANTDGVPMPKERFCCLALTPWSGPLSALAFTGAAQAERIAGKDNAWKGGVIAADWLWAKYILTARAAGGKPMHGDQGERFRREPANRELLARLAYAVTGPGWQAPATPALKPW